MENIKSFIEAIKTIQMSQIIDIVTCAFTVAIGMTSIIKMPDRRILKPSNRTYNNANNYREQTTNAIEFSFRNLYFSYNHSDAKLAKFLEFRLKYAADI